MTATNLARLLGEVYVRYLKYEAPENPCKHMVRFIQKEITAQEKQLNSEFVKEVLRLATAHYKSKNNVVFVNRLCFVDESLYSGRITVVGDLHGQYRDLRYLLSPNGPIGFPTPVNQVIFNGDMVDRGDMSVEIVVLLALISFSSPGSVHMLKGNHEASRHLTEKMGFCNEVQRKYPNDKALLKAFLDLFAALPVAAVIDNAAFVVHGGLELVLKLSAEQDIDHELLRVIELSKRDVQQVVYYVDDECALDVCATDEPEMYMMQSQSSSSSAVMV